MEGREGWLERRSEESSRKILERAGVRSRAD